VPWRKKAEKSDKFRVWDKVLDESAHVFKDTRIPLQQSIGLAEGFCAKNQLNMKFQFLKSKMADSRHFEKPLNRHNSARV